MFLDISCLKWYRHLSSFRWRYTAQKTESFTELHIFSPSKNAKNSSKTNNDFEKKKPSKKLPFILTSYIDIRKKRSILTLVCTRLLTFTLNSDVSFSRSFGQYFKHKCKTITTTPHPLSFPEGIGDLNKKGIILR